MLICKQRGVPRGMTNGYALRAGEPYRLQGHPSHIRSTLLHRLPTPRGADAEIYRGDQYKFRGTAAQEGHLHAYRHSCAAAAWVVCGRNI